jgi:Flp pilus assembly protein TadD
MSLGNALQAMRNTLAAVEAHRTAISHGPDSAEAHNQLALSLYEADDFEHAVAEFRTAAQLRSDYASAWSNLGNVLGRLGRVDEAISA